jgi:hypothetical protein
MRKVTSPQVGESMNALLALLAALGELAAGGAAGGTEAIGQVVADDGRPVYRVCGSVEATPDLRSGVLDAGSEDSQPVDRVVDLEGEPDEQEKEQENDRVADNCPGPLGWQSWIQAHTPSLHGSRVGEWAARLGPRPRPT